jgi:peptidoglycan/LPS O-acetylase OafA/YrhL
MISHVLAASGASFWGAAALGRAIDGASAVILFFVLSGLVLALPYFGERKLFLVEFYVKRVFRLYPAFWLSLAVACAALALFPAVVASHTEPATLGSFGAQAPWGGWTVANLARYAALIYPFTDYRSVLHHSVVWSLVVEMRMSIVLPAIIIAVAWTRRRPLVASLGLLLLLMASEPVFANPFATFAWHQLFWAGIFLVGVVAAKYLSGTVAAMQRLSSAARAALAGASFLLYLATPSVIGLDDYYRFAAVTALAALGMMLAALSARRLGAFLVSRFPQFLGRISYSLYLLHGPLYSLMKAILLPFMGLLPALVLYVAATVLAAYLSARYVEAPMIRWGASLAARTRAPLFPGERNQGLGSRAKPPL